MEKVNELTNAYRSFLSSFASPDGSKSFDMQEFLRTARSSRKLVLIIVFIALFLDNMLLTTVVPVIPNLLTESDYATVFTVIPQINITRIVYDESTDPAVVEFAKSTCRSPKKIKRLFDNITDFIWGMSDMPKIKTTIEVPPCLRQENFTDTIVELGQQRRHSSLVNENVKVGIMFASKAVVQLITNPIIGPLTNKIGYTIPMFVGFVILTVSTTIFAFATNYMVLFFARALQGVGSACSSTAGMGMLASRYTDDAERGQALGFALGGLALGVLVGPPFGGFMYEFISKEAPFLILAALAILDGVLQLVLLNPTVKPEDQQGTPLMTLMKDPYILITTGAIMLGNLGIAMLEPTMPIWMLDTMEASKFQQGAAFLPASISYLIGTFIFGRIAHNIGRWRTGLIGMLIVSFALFVIPFASHVYHLIIPNFFLGFAIGMVDSSMMPTMGYLVDLRYVSVYGTVYAIADVAFCMGFAVGPAISGNLVRSVGFNWMLWSIAIINILFSPLFLFLKNPPGKDHVNEDGVHSGGTKFAPDGGVYEQLDNGEETEFGSGADDHYYATRQQSNAEYVASNESASYYGSNSSTNAVAAADNFNSQNNPFRPNTTTTTATGSNNNFRPNQQPGYGY